MRQFIASPRTSSRAAATPHVPAPPASGHRNGRTILAGVLVCSLLSGCGTDTFHQTIAGGAILGAGLGAGVAALACAVVKGPNPALCAAGGGVLGGAAGSLTGYLVATKQQAARDHIRQIDRVTADISQQNRTMRGEVVAAQQVAHDGTQQLAAISAEQRAGSINADQARSERASIERESTQLGTLISQRQQQVDNFRGAGQQLNQYSREYSSELAQMQRNVAALRQQKDALDHAMQESG